MEIVRATPSGGWVQVDDADPQVIRAAPTGWLEGLEEAAAETGTTPRGMLLGVG
jgi:hypothetical protein